MRFWMSRLFSRRAFSRGVKTSSSCALATGIGELRSPRLALPLPAPMCPELVGEITLRELPLSSMPRLGDAECGGASGVGDTLSARNAAGEATVVGGCDVVGCAAPAAAARSSAISSSSSFLARAMRNERGSIVLLALSLLDLVLGLGAGSPLTAVSARRRLPVGGAGATPDGRGVSIDESESDETGGAGLGAGVVGAGVSAPAGDDERLDDADARLTSTRGVSTSSIPSV